MGIEEIRRLKDGDGEKKPSHPKIGGGAKMTRWFEDRRLEMKCRCMHCGGPTSAWSDIYYKFCIAHILPKRLFKSVAIHPLNWIELCHFGNSCHTNFDNHILDIIELNCYNLIIERFVAMYPDISKDERKYIPDALLQYINIDT